MTLIIYVVPLEWHCRISLSPPPAGHYQPAGFDRRYYRVLFTQARTPVRAHRAGKSS
jgi:hypothetical protein